MKRRFAIAVIVSITMLCAAPFFGAAAINFHNVFDVGTPSYQIFWDMRVPRVLLAWITGATLSVCGLIFQALFRNSLASPDMLGVSSGAALGAVLYIRLGFAATFWGVISGGACAAFLGAFTAVAVLYAAGGIKRGGFSSHSLLLSGIALNFLCGSLNMIIQYTGGYTDSFRMMRWSMGRLDTIGLSAPLASFPGFIFIVLTGWVVGPQLDLLVCGEALAASRGVSVKILRRFLFIVVSLSVGVNVALCGPIGFVGLMCPHICRRLTGWVEHRCLAVLCVFVGGFFLVLCDAAARTLWAPAELPVGILTSSLGALFFIWLVIKVGD